MIRHELESIEYINNDKALNKFFKGFKLTKSAKVIGFSDTIGHEATYTLTLEDEQIIDEIIFETMDYIATYGGYAYIMKNDTIIKEIELQ